MRNLLALVFLAFALQSCNEAPKMEVINDIELPDDKEGSKVEPNRTERIGNYKRMLDSINQSLCWTETTFGLWKSKEGELALKTNEGTDVGFNIAKYIAYLADGRSLAEVIDTATFKYLGSSFYKDRNHVYTHYAMVDGGNFWIVEEADVKTFKVIGDCYAKDKNYIFGERAMQMDSVDYRTFKTCDGCGCFAKDKDGYYFWDDKIDVNDIDNEETLNIINKLKKLK